MTAETSTPTVPSKVAGQQHRPDRAPRGRQPALVEDHRQTDDADRARDMRIVELDPAGAIGAEQHPEPEEGDEHRHVQPGGGECGGDRAGEHGADEEQQGPGFQQRPPSSRVIPDRARASSITDGRSGSGGILG